MNTRDAARKDAGVGQGPKVNEAKPKMGRKEKAPPGSLIGATQDFFIEVLTKAASKLPANLTKDGVTLDAKADMVMVSAKGYSKSDFEAKVLFWLTLDKGSGPWPTVDLWTDYSDAMSGTSTAKGPQLNLRADANLMVDVPAFIAQFYQGR